MMENYADIEGPVRIGLLWLIGLTGLLILVILALAALLAWWLKRRRARVQEAQAPRRSPLEIARERLERLRAEAVAMEAEAYTVEVSDVVRDYLESALSIPAREQTSEEFLQTLSVRPGMPDVLHAHMPAFLTQCDLVKFARQGLGEKEREGLLETAGTVVEETDRSLRQPVPAEGKENIAV